VTWKLTIAGGNLSFSAAHFITLDGSYEPLHGHNYDIRAEIDGTGLTSDSYVLDFGVIKAWLRGYIAEINHRFLLPLQNPHMEIRRKGDEWEIHLPDGARFVLPVASVVALEIDNATAERLAELFAGRLRDDLHARGVTNVRAITVGISETAMQTAFYTLTLVSE
jgi:6-pyruvoyl-tetrahydropterin synthase